MRFSVIMCHYQGCESDETLQRGIDSLKKQTFKDFEVIVMHDGELLRPWNVDVGDLKVRLLNSDVHYDDWGHSLRDIGIGLAEGEFLLITNADNIYYQCAFESFDKQLRNHKGVEIILSRIRMMGMKIEPVMNGMSMVTYPQPRDYSVSAVLPGRPKLGHVDIMQSCISKRLWVEHGGWVDKSIDSDGKQIIEICASNPWHEATLVVGEHY